MYWRGTPKGLTHRLSGSQPDWPRNGAILRGYVHELEEPQEGNTKWLEVVEISPNGKLDQFVPAPESWMLFKQGGPVLHQV